MLELTLAPALVAVATLAARRWGEGLGGLVSAFPAVVAPALLITAQLRGAAFAQHAATGTLFGVATLSGFVVVYGTAATRSGWPLSLVAGWAAAASLAAVVAALDPAVGIPAVTMIAAVSLLVAHRSLPPAAGEETVLPRRDGIVLRMILTAALVLAVTVTSILGGALLGGMLAGLPILASILVVFTHRGRGAAAAIALLRGTLVGMVSFVSFCATVAVLLPAGIATSFASALLVAVATQALAFGAVRTRSRAASSPAR